jgi:hypothetical protein
MESIQRSLQELQGAVRYAREELEEFLRPLWELFPDRRLQRTAIDLVQGLIAAQSPHITKAMGVVKGDAGGWALSKRGYRLMNNQRVRTKALTKSLYRLAQRTVCEEGAERLVVAIDPVQFEKPYARRMEGVSQVHKSRPPNLAGRARITWGYPAITATIVNLSRPATTYAHWFSYQSPDFLSQNREVYRALRITRALFPHHQLCFVMDGGGDDRKFFHWVQKVQGTFIVTVAHKNREVEVWNARRHRWEPISMEELMALVLWQGRFQVRFLRAGRSQKRLVRLGWYRIRLPGESAPLWLLVAETLDADEEDGDEERLLGLLTNIPITNMNVAQQVYQDWRLRGRIEHGYRFDQEAGLDIEQLLVRSLDRMQRLFVFVLWAMHFVTHILRTWPQMIVEWFQLLGGKLARKSDRSGLYWLLWGLASAWNALATLSFINSHPFPHPGLDSPKPSTYG